jgi:hypothetical protein
MGRRGPAPQPIEIKQLHNTVQPHRDKDRQPLAQVYLDEALSAAPVPAKLRRKDVKERWNSVTGRLLHLKLIYPEDLPTLESAFLALEQSYRVMDRIKRLEKQERELEKDLEEWRPLVETEIGLRKSDSAQQWDSLDKIRTAITRQQSSYRQLVATYNQIVKDFYVTPAQKMRGMLEQKESEVKDSAIVRAIKRAQNK